MEEFTVTFARYNGKVKTKYCNSQAECFASVPNGYWYNIYRNTKNQTRRFIDGGLKEDVRG